MNHPAPDGADNAKSCNMMHTPAVRPAKDERSANACDENMNSGGERASERKNEPNDDVKEKKVFFNEKQDEVILIPMRGHGRTLSSYNPIMGLQGRGIQDPRSTSHVALGKSTQNDALVQVSD